MDGGENNRLRLTQLPLLIPRTMPSTSTPLILLGTLFTAAGYGATFLISVWFRAHGGSDIDAGNTLGMALVGTLIGVPLVG